MNIQTKILTIVFTIIITSCTGTKPMLGKIENTLSPCPDKPNCVSSQSQDQSHYVEPFHYTGSQQMAFDQLVFIIRQFPRTQITKQTENYLHVEFKSAWFGFIDDVEFLFSSAQQIQVRSASRIGYSDFGVNRKRINSIRAKFEKASLGTNTNDV
jgi:uncharacterized protein (DUF1499 family)